MSHKVLIFVLFASGTVLAQFRTANLSGTAADEAGRPLAGVGIKVIFLTPSRDFVGPTLVQEVWSGLTDEDGDYKVASLLLGNYQVEASLAGFDTKLRWVPLRASADEMILDITLEAEEISEAVQRQTSLPVPERREPIKERAPVKPNETQRGSPDAQMSPPPAELQPTEPPLAELQPTEEPPTEEPPIRPYLLGELNGLLWAAILFVFLLGVFMGILWARRSMHQERNEWHEWVDETIEPPKIAVSTPIEEPVQVEQKQEQAQEQEPARVKEPGPIERALQATRLEPVQAQKEIQAPIEEPVQAEQKQEQAEEQEPVRVKAPGPIKRALQATRLEELVQAQEEIQATREEPFKVETFNSDHLRQMEDHFEKLGEAVAYPRLSERHECLAEGFQIAYKPGTGQEVWITHSSGDHIMMLKPK